MKIKKIILSSFVVLAFAAYTVYYRLSGGNNSSLNLSPDLPLNIPASTETNNETQLGIYKHSFKSRRASEEENKFFSSLIPSDYKNGEYAGTSVFTIFGDVQVAAVIKRGRITDVKFLKFPNDRTTSINISNESLPRLKTEAIAVQHANVDIVSGATQTSEGFIESLASALLKAKS